jgi:hypothetical protein
LQDRVESFDPTVMIDHYMNENEPRAYGRLRLTFVGECVNCLSHYQHFPDIVPAQEELDRAEIVEKVFDVTVIEHAL